MSALLNKKTHSRGLSYFSFNPAESTTTITHELSSFQTQQAQNGQRDYIAYDGAQDAAIAEIKGRRKTQEDRVFYGLLWRFNQLNLTERKNILTAAFKRLQKQHGNQAYCGSAVMITIFDNQHIYTMYSGDSRSYLVSICENSQVEIKQLNKHIHTPSYEEERLKALGKAPIKTNNNKHRLCQEPYLSLSRSIGDTASESAGLIHEADIDVIERPILSGKDKAFIVTASDGLFETKRFRQPELLASFFKIRKNLTSWQLASALVRTAYQDGSKDNITVIVRAIHQLPAALNYSVVFGNFDGHGGATVSDALAKDTIHILQDEINCRCHSRERGDPS